MSNLQLVVSVVALTVVGLATAPGVFAIAHQARHGTPKDNFYEDRDGKSTPEAVAAFSNKKAKAAITILSVGSFATSLAVSILALDWLYIPNYLLTAAFVCDHLPCRLESKFSTDLPVSRASSWCKMCS
jgi:hypothetical protein